MEGRQLQVATLRVLITALAVALFVWLTYELRVLLINLLIALTLASAIAPIAEWGERKRISRGTMVMAVYLGVALMYTVFAIMLTPAVKSQAKNLWEHMPVYLAGLTSWYESTVGFAGGQAKAAVGVNSELFHNLAAKIGHETLDVGAGLLGLLLNGLLILFLTAYFVIQADQIWRKLLMWIPQEKRTRAAPLIRPLAARMGGYVRGQIMVSLAVSLFLTIGLTLLGVNYSLLLGVLAGLLNLVPFVGSLSAAIFALVVASNQSVWLAGATLGLFVLEQWVESNFIVPHLLGSQVELHPLIVLFAILIGATLLGVAGALVAVPVASALLFLAQEFYLKPLHEKEGTPIINGNNYEAKPPQSSVTGDTSCGETEHAGSAATAAPAPAANESSTKMPA